MKTCIKHDFGKVKAYELGYSLIGSPLMTVYFYILDGMLIDTAQKHMEKTFLNILGNEKIENAVLTHYHEDHSGNAAALKRVFKNISIYGNQHTCEAMRNGFAILPYQHYIWGRAGRLKLKLMPEVIETNSFKLRPIHTPGHSPDHTVFLEENEGWLFSGDLYISSRINLFREDEKIKETIESLKKIVNLNFNSLFCAHNPHINNGKKRLRKKLIFLENLFGKIAILVEKGYDEKSIVTKLKREEDKTIKLITCGNVSFTRIVKSAIRDIIE